MDIIQQTETFPKSTAIDVTVRRKMERKRSTVKPWDVKETLKELHRRSYFPRASRQQGSDSIGRWPKVLKAVIEGQAELAMASFGAVLFYLQRNLIDHEILSMGNIKAYIPPSTSNVQSNPVMNEIEQSDPSDQDLGLDRVPPMTPAAPNDPTIQFECREELLMEESEINHMALDGTTLRNLEVLLNSKTHTPTGSLWSKINYTKTPHGSRLLRAWLLRPLFRKADIERRADAVQELVSGGAAVALGEARTVLGKCGDIERLLSRVHSMGASGDADSTGYHPNQRAVLYETATHTKRKVGDFSKLLNGLRHAIQIPEIFEGVEIKSGLLQKIVRPVEGGGCFPAMTEELDWFFDNFDCEQAARGLFEPSRGVDEAYDEACDAIQDILQELQDYKQEMCSTIPSARTWKYVNIKNESKDKYLIELPASVRVPDDFIMKGKR